MERIACQVVRQRDNNGGKENRECWDEGGVTISNKESLSEEVTCEEKLRRVRDWII